MTGRRVGTRASGGVAVDRCEPAAGSLPLLTEVRIDWAVVLDLGISLVGTGIFRLLPALFTHQVANALADRSHAASAPSRRARNLLVRAEIAFSMMLVAGGDCSVESLMRLEHVDPASGRSREPRPTSTVPTPRYREEKAVVKRARSAGSKG